MSSTYTGREYDKGRVESKVEAMGVGRIVRSQSTVMDVKVANSKI